MESGSAFNRAVAVARVGPAIRLGLELFHALELKPGFSRECISIILDCSQFAAPEIDTAALVGCPCSPVEAAIADRRHARRQQVRIAIVSDIHGNRRAFAAILADLRQVAPDLTLHGGDLAANGAYPAEIIDQIRGLGWPGVRGNTDEMLWAPERLAEVAVTHSKLVPILAAFQEMIPITRASLGEERLHWLERLPHVHWEGVISVVHASPRDLWRAPLPSATDAELESTYAGLRAQIVVYAHIHRPFIRRVGGFTEEGFTVANTGSVSLSYDGDRRASYLVIDGQAVTVRRVEYDIEDEARELLRSGLPHAGWLCRILRSGHYSPPE